MKIAPLLCILLTLFAPHLLAQKNSIQFKTKNLEIEKLKDNVLLHRSFLQTDSFGNVGCNGMIIYNDGKAIIFDTPTNNIASNELIKWVTDSLKCKIIAVVPTHFHEDCLGGLEAFHDQNIPSYASNSTIKLAKDNHFSVPKYGFDGQKTLMLGKEKVILAYFGEGHTSDNIVGYYPSKKTLFGGCLIKELNASKGYLGDANVMTWPSTIQKIKRKYKDLELVIPGHGQPGNINLLDYTSELFKVE